MKSFSWGDFSIRRDSFPGFNFTRVYIVFPFLCITAGCLGLAHIPAAWQVRLAGVPGEPPALALRSLLCIVLIGLAGWQSLAIKREALTGIADGKNFTNLYRHPALAELQRLRGSQPSSRVATVAGDISSGPLTGCSWAYGLETADGYIPLYTERYHRFWEAVILPLEAHDAATVNSFRRKGSRAYLYLPAREKAGGQTVRLDSHARLNLLSLGNVRYIVSAVPLEAPGLHQRSGTILDRQNDWIGRPRRDRLLGMILGDYPGTPLYVYENVNALPRIFLAANIRVFEEPDRLLDALASAPVGELGTTAFVMRSDLDGPIAAGRDGSRRGTAPVTPARQDRAPGRCPQRIGADRDRQLQPLVAGIRRRGAGPGLPGRSYLPGGGPARRRARRRLHL